MRGILLHISLSLCSFLSVNGLVKDCQIMLDMQREELRCLTGLKQLNVIDLSEGCAGIWDNYTCWMPAKVGETVSLPCPLIYRHFSREPGNVSKKCMADGWTETFPSYDEACVLTAEYNISEETERVGCKIILVFFHYFVTANFYWLMVEGLYLHTLLMVFFSENKYFILYMLIGWGMPTLITIIWIILRIYLDDVQCWDTNNHPIPWTTLRVFIVVSIAVTFLLFTNITRILMQKLKSPDVSSKSNSQYMRLAKSLLLLILLLGIHYIIFAFLPDEINKKFRIVFELCLGSFQGFFVAVWYCFLNSEVQVELKKKWRILTSCSHLRSNYTLHSGSLTGNGTAHRNTRAQSILQTEMSLV
ncbi:vasoactive intestinal polypeptide receptor-like isoform X2 [Mobula hypostoma]|uniref:vasoactive intestinal polypeptide receptor-like isoform X2 n=1 Tax=Mobula hypostoma TaxID=723540 RepID=UPI002FC32BED